MKIYRIFATQRFIAAVFALLVSIIVDPILIHAMPVPFDTSSVVLVPSVSWTLLNDTLHINLHDKQLTLPARQGLITLPVVVPKNYKRSSFPNNALPPKCSLDAQFLILNATPMVNGLNPESAKKRAADTLNELLKDCSFAKLLLQDAYCNKAKLAKTPIGYKKRRKGDKSVLIIGTEGGSHSDFEITQRISAGDMTFSGQLNAADVKASVPYNSRLSKRRVPVVVYVVFTGHPLEEE
ncbi:hypothetical protein FBU30_005324 [Linnemannia zychae]|nr:hypothetical protein FBU30_005324 [Linnemannia zychae]